MIACKYSPGRGMYVNLGVANHGMCVVLAEHMSIAAIQSHLRELMEYLA